MGDKSRIEWTDSTWTPIRARRRDTGKVGVHCERVSPACANCYAAAFNRRMLPNHGTGLDFTVPNRERVEIFVDEEMLLQPLRWRRGRRIFVCSQTDLFADFVTDEMIDRVFAVMASSRKHAFQVLTKRPERAQQFLSAFKPSPKFDGFVTRNGIPHDETKFGEFMSSPDRWPLPNVWLGTTVENQEWADKRIPLLLQTPAAKRFVSFEPLLGQIDIGFNRWVWIGRAIHGDFPIGHNHVVQPGIYRADANQHGALSVNGLGIKPGEYELLQSLDWAIAGGESGHGARPMHPDWAQSLRDQCVNAGVAFFHKQNGEFTWVGRGYGGGDDVEPYPARFGKMRAGRLLDGREWNEVPAVENG